MGIGTKLALAICFFLALALGTMAYLGNSYFREHFARNFFVQQQILVNALADEIETKIRIFRKELVAAAERMPAELLADPRQAQRVLQESFDTLRMFDNGLFLVDRAGRIVASTHGRYYWAGTDFSGQETIRLSLQQGRTLLSEPQVVPGEEHPSLFFTVPLNNASGQLAGLLVGSLNLQVENFLGRLSTKQLGTEDWGLGTGGWGHLHLTSREGATIAGQPMPATEAFPNDRAKEFASHELYHPQLPTSNAAHAHGLVGTGSDRFLVTRIMLPETGWELTTIFPARALFAPLQKAQLFFSTLSMALILGSALLVWAASHILTRPLKQFVDHLRGFLGTGNLPSHIESAAGDEVGTLCRVFNQLVGEIEQDRREIAEAKNFAEQILRDSPSPRVVLDRQGRVIAWNRAVERLSGVPAEQMLGTRDFYKPFYPEPHPTLADFILNEDPEKLKHDYPNIEPIADVPGGLRGEGPFNNVNGRDIYMIFSAAPIRNRDGELVAVVESLEDVTVVKDLAEQERRYRMLMETVAQAILEYLRTCDISRLASTLVDKLVNLIDARYGFLFDYESSGDARILAVSHNDSDDKVGDRMARKVRLAIAEQGFYRVLRNDDLLFASLSKGETLVIKRPSRHFFGSEPDSEQALPADSILCVPLKIGKKIVGGIGLANRTEEFDAREIFEVEAFSQLAALAIQNTRAEEARKETEERLQVTQKFEAIGQLAGGIAHDFNNLLTVINGFSELLIKDLHNNDSATLFAREILSAGEKAENLTGQLLAFSRKQVVKPQTLDLCLLVGGFDKILRRLLRENIEYSFTAQESEILVQADPGQVEQILMNLVINARDAIGKQVGQIQVKLSSIRLDAASVQGHPGYKPGYYGIIAVEDNGCGMAPEVRERIFEPFFTTKGPGQGSGLGLATVYGIIKQSGGYLEVDSQSGAGSKFTIYLPAGDSAEAVNTQEMPQVGKLTGKGGILVVDDEPAIRELALISLSKMGFEVYSANSYETAVNQWDLLQGVVDLLLADIGLPGRNGLELARKLRELKPELKILFMSAYGELHDSHDFDLLQGEAFLQKPFSTKKLGEALMQVLSTDIATE